MFITGDILVLGKVQWRNKRNRNTFITATNPILADHELPNHTSYQLNPFREKVEGHVERAYYSHYVNELITRPATSWTVNKRRGIVEKRGEEKKKKGKSIRKEEATDYLSRFLARKSNGSSREIYWSSQISGWAIEMLDLSMWK